jgi:Fe-Mn family superoxide dismutase
MNQFQEQKFNIPELKGIGAKTIEEHVKLYQGYLKHSNLILEKIAELGATPESAEKNVFVLGELQRRFGFEFDGMRNHEYYFEQFEGGAAGLPDGSKLKAAVEKEWGSWDGWLARFKAVAMTRGVGWAVLYHDPKTDRMLNAWLDEQHLGQLNGLHFILGLDMWEHSYMLDNPPSEKKKYVEAFFENLNWGKVEERMKKM